MIADLAIEHDLIVVTDEVYEHLVFAGADARPDGDAARAWRERTLTISSGGKTFNTTGWKIGWMCGPAPTGRRGHDGQAVPHLRQRRPVPAGDRRRARPARRVLRRLAADLAGQARPPRSRASSRPGSTSYRAAGDVLHDRRHPPAAARRRRHGVLPRAAGAVRRRGDPEPGVLRPHRARPAPRAVRVLQAARGARRRGRTACRSWRRRRREHVARRRDPARHRRGTTATPTSSGWRR